MRALAAAVFALLAFGATPANACSCRKPTEASVLANADIGVEGEVIRVRTFPRGGAGRIVATFRVSKVLKGRVPRTIRVETRESSAACGVNFIVGQRYRFGAYATGRNYSTGLCSQF